jgi:predicted TIM-barrel fold metal-dependent hydrolase
MIIDFHTHVFPPHIKEKRDEYVLKDPCFSLLYSNPKATLATVEDIITSMEECGIDKSVILNIGWLDNDICSETNSYIIECVNRYPERLIGFCTIQPSAGEKALKELERCVRNGIKGVGEMRPDMQGLDIEDNKTLQPIMEYVINNDLLYLIHASEPVGHQYAGKGSVTPEVIYPLILENPELKLICAHWGGGLPFYGLMPEVNRAFRNVYFDTAATPFLYDPQIFHHVIEIIGSDKILFGSDFPLMSPKRIVDQISSLNIDEHDSVKILGTNAQRLLSLDK